MGTVYLADHMLLDQQRALKFMANRFSDDPRALKRFRGEAQAAIQLRHPNVVEVLDLDQAEDGSQYIAMEYIVGRELEKELLTGAFPYAEPSAWFAVSHWDCRRHTQKASFIGTSNRPTSSSRTAMGSRKSRKCLISASPR